MHSRYVDGRNCGLNMEVQQIKQRFGIIGRSMLLDRAIETAMSVAPTDLSVLITGESGVGKEIMPQIIHSLSSRKHNSYIAVNCGAIPEGTIDSELFGHEKGSFTGAQGARKGYFEEANNGTVFLDEVAELPIQTQVKLLRVLETGEYIKVGSSKVLKTDVRIVAATNVNIPEAIKKNKFREDLYYRLNTVPINLPSLKNRKEDIHLLFRKFASDFAQKYRMPGIKLSEDAISVLSNYPWPGNIRQLKNIAEQLSIIEKDRLITPEILIKYLPNSSSSNLPMVVDEKIGSNEFSERDILYKVLFEMKKDVHELKSLVSKIMQSGGDNIENSQQIIEELNADMSEIPSVLSPIVYNPNTIKSNSVSNVDDSFQHHMEVEESLSIEDQEKELIRKALVKHRGRRKNAAKELGISERTLYRKIKEYELK